MSMIIDGTNGLTFNNNTVQASAGQVLQVVQGTLGGSGGQSFITSSSTFADTGLTATITPKFTTSKILIMVTCAGVGKRTTNTYLQLRLLRGSTSITTMDDGSGFTGSTQEIYSGTVSINYLDSPATTSATTYKIQGASGNNTASATFGVNVVANYPVSTITLMEIAQ